MFVLLSLVAVLSLLVPFSQQSKISFELPALAENNRKGLNARCFTLYMGKDVLSTGTYSSTGNSASQLHFDIHDSKGNVYNARSGAKDVEKFSFTSHEYSDYTFCFANVLNRGVYPDAQYTRTIDFDIRIGAEVDTEELAKKEHLKPIEVDLRVLESVLEGVVAEMEYLKVQSFICHGSGSFWCLADLLFAFFLSDKEDSINFM
jgi:hypothetical protein